MVVYFWLTLKICKNKISHLLFLTTIKKKWQLFGWNCQLLDNFGKIPFVKLHIRFLTYNFGFKNILKII